MKKFLGIDAGATKTHALILAEDGSPLGFGEGGTGNHEVNGFGHARGNIGHAVKTALERAGVEVADLSRACYCLAGADVTSDYETIPVEIVEPVTGALPYDLKNDSYGCLRGGTRDPFGVMINCGTAQVAVGRNREGKEIRIGGYGVEYGDFTGGTVIVYQAVAAVVRAHDGRAPSTALTQDLLKAAGVDTVQAFIDRTYRDEDFLLSLGIPILVFRASAQGDRVAKRIILEAANEMALTATTLIERLGMLEETFDVVAAGSVFKGEDPDFMGTIEKAVHAIAPRATFTTPRHDPVVGAALLAMEAAGIVVTQSIYDKLEASRELEISGDA